MCSSAVFHGQAKVGAKCITLGTVTEADWDTIAQLSVMNYHRLVMYLVDRGKEAGHVNGPYITFHSPRCTCNTEVKVELRKEIKKALTVLFLRIGCWRELSC